MAGSSRDSFFPGEIAPPPSAYVPGGGAGRGWQGGGWGGRLLPAALLVVCMAFPAGTLSSGRSSASKAHKGVSLPRGDPGLFLRRLRGSAAPGLRGGGEGCILHDAVGAMADMDITRLFHLPGSEDALCPDVHTSLRSTVRAAKLKQRCYIRRGRHVLSRPLIVRGRGQGERVIHVAGERGDDGVSAAWTDVEGEVQVSRGWPGQAKAPLNCTAHYAAHLATLLLTDSFPQIRERTAGSWVSLRMQHACPQSYDCVVDIGGGKWCFLGCEIRGINVGPALPPSSFCGNRHPRVWGWSRLRGRWWMGSLDADILFLVLAGVLTI